MQLSLVEDRLQIEEGRATFLGIRRHARIVHHDDRRALIGGNVGGAGGSDEVAENEIDIRRGQNMPDIVARPNFPISILPPEMPASWWEAMLLGNEGDLVSAADVKLVCRHIRQRLAERATATGAFQPHANGGNADSKIWNEKLDFISTVGQLHAAVLESFQPDCWRVFTRLYHEAAGLKPKHQSNPDNAPVHVAADGK